LRGRNLLMILSTNAGDYKFPGGGVDEGETYSQALCREVQEKCGMSVRHVGAEIGAVIEYNLPVEKSHDVFKMTSLFYYCDVEDGFGKQKLDDYELALGLKPLWIDVDSAIQLNKALLHADNAPRWLQREIFVLEYIHQNLFLTPGT